MDTLSQIETASYGIEGDGNQTLKVNGIHCDRCGLIPFNFGEPDADELEVDLPQSTIAHFRLIRPLGRGGFGVVWLAEDISLHRRVALKTPGRSGDSISMLLHEAQSAARLRHPNIVSIFETGTTEDGQAFIASEYIEGLNLKDILSTGRPTQKTALDLLVKIADAVSHAHDMGIIHRDLKPANIMIDTRSVPYVADFGLAKHVSADESISSEGQVLGTANYMSPEQATGQTRRTDHRTDIYALGVMLFEMLTGHLPFRGNTRAVIHQKTTQEAPSPRSLDPTIPKDLETICMKCLEREPEKRLASATLLREELERIQRGTPIVSRPIGNLEKSFRLMKRYPLVSGLSLGLLLSLTAGLIGVTQFWRDALRNADLAQQGVYRSQMALAAQHYATGDIRGIQATLNRVSNESEFERLHDFSWHFYDRLVRKFETVVVHGDEVIALGLSNDGAFLATVGFDGHCAVWDVESGSLLNRVKPGQDRFTSVSFSPNRFQLATGGSNGFCTIWNPNNFDVPLKSIKHGPPVRGVYFSPDGKLLMSHGEKGAVRVWDVQTEELVVEVPSGPLGTNAAAFSPKGDMFASGGAAGVLRVWQISTGIKLWEVDNSFDQEAIEAICFSSDGTQVAVAGEMGRYRIFDTEDGEMLYEKYTYQGKLGSVAYLKGTELLACTGTTNTLNVFDVQRGQSIATLPTHSLGQGRATLSANGRFYAMGSDDGTAKVLAIENLRQPQILWHASPVLQLRFSQDGQRVFSLGPLSEVISHSIYDGTSEVVAPKREVTSRELLVDELGQRLFVGVPNPQIFVTSMGTQESQLRESEISILKRSIAGIHFEPESHSLIAIGRQGGLLKYDVDELSSPAVESSIPGESRVSAISSAAGGKLAIGVDDGHVYVLAKDLSVERELQASAVATAIDFCGPYLIVGLSNGNIELFNWQSQQSEKARIFEGHVAEITAIAHFPSRKTFATGSRDHRIKIWDIASGDAITTLYGHGRRVFSLAISPDGKTIVSGGLDGDIHLWKSSRN